MTVFGFVIGTTLVNLLYVFDLYFTKFQERKSLWGATMVSVKNQSKWLTIIPLYTVICLWIVGLVFGNQITLMQIWLSGLFWVWIVALYYKSTFYYYKEKVQELKTK